LASALALLPALASASVLAWRRALVLALVLMVSPRPALALDSEAKATVDAEAAVVLPLVSHLLSALEVLAAMAVTLAGTGDERERQQGPEVHVALTISPEVQMIVAVSATMQQPVDPQRIGRHRNPVGQNSMRL
jgi:hypothetical protein